VGGFDRVFEIGRNFRNEGLSRKHNPEFTMLEVYQAYSDHRGMMGLIQDLVTTLGREVLRMEREFNKAAGFTEADDELPAFFYDETLAPTGKTARHHSTQVNQRVRELLA